MTQDECRATLRAMCQLHGTGVIAAAYEFHPRYLAWVLDGVISAGPRLLRLLSARLEPVEQVV